MAQGHDVRQVKAQLNEDNAKDFTDTEIISCFIYSQLNAATLAQLPKLKLVTTRSTGTDHIDLDYCTAHNITVKNVPAYGEHTVAEHVFALLLALSRNIPKATQRTRQGDFSFSGLCGFDLFGKTLGVIGTGAIGTHVARIAQGFGMQVLGYDMNPKDNAYLQQVSFDALLKQADVISLHVPGGLKNKHLLGQKEFELMKDGVVLINTARGAAVDVKALFMALESGKVAAAGLDVLPEENVMHRKQDILKDTFANKHNLETLLLDHALLNHKNVIVTPHSAFFTREAVDKIIAVTVDNIMGFIALQ
jgi:D-lactate dehydrogenase